MKRTAGILLAFGLGIFAGTASAATLTISSVEGVWTDVVTTKEKPGKLTGRGTDMISWGSPWPGHVRSSYSFAGGDPVTTDTDGAFLIGAYTHHNGTIWANSQDLLATGLNVSVSGNLDGQSFTFSNLFRFVHDETLNAASPCPQGPTGNCGDIVGIASLVAAPFVIAQGGSIFTLIIEGFVEALGGPVITDFLTEEGLSRTLYLQASLRIEAAPPPAPVPLPASALLLVAALGILAMGWPRHPKRRD